MFNSVYLNSFADNDIIHPDSLGLGAQVVSVLRLVIYDRALLFCYRHVLYENGMVGVSGVSYLNRSCLHHGEF